MNTTINQSYMSVNASASTPIYLQWENFVNYMHSFGKHNLNAMLGTSYIDNSSFSVSGSVTGGDGDFGFKKDDPRYAYFAYATATAVKSISGGEEIIGRKLAYFGRLNYDYAGNIWHSSLFVPMRQTHQFFRLPRDGDTSCSIFGMDNLSGKLHAECEDLALALETAWQLGTERYDLKPWLILIPFIHFIRHVLSLYQRASVSGRFDAFFDR